MQIVSIIENVLAGSFPTLVQGRATYVNFVPVMIGNVFWIQRVLKTFANEVAAPVARH